MALSPLNWYYVGTRTFGYNPFVSGANEAVWRLGNATVYADGTPRVIGAGSAWTWFRETSGSTTLAAYGAPPINPLDMRYLIGGSDTAGALPVGNLAAPDAAFATGVVYFGMNRQSGAYTTWSSLTPFTNANGFSRYWRTTSALPGGYISVSMWESQEAAVIQYSSRSGTVSAVAMGALFDPLSYQSGVSCESDGRLYYMFGTGSTFGVATDWLGQAAVAGSTGILGYHYGVANTYHGGYFSPGTNTLLNTARFGLLTPTNQLLSANGALAQIPYSITNATTGNFIGQSRNFYMVRDGASLYEPRQGAIRTGTTFASNLGTQGDCVLFSRG
jgi:hypothetical protein